ncbi:helix-turn-helix domain-containing protein [Pontibacter burrus]|uniref:Helix-turn-helix transcriptional regulator n=1 Tax=Pontibacter burrus TaxID=2704466 RepID=A0A6B3LTU5_9BACT|nr:helix-turn-helix domain-containing protein [Pontibacter burrus]NEM97428.1 helix-turn-helix transcriptional regulator [Pontibacter burrus]
MERVEGSPSKQHTLGYSNSCEIVHVTDKNYHALKGRKSKNRIMSSCLTSLEDEVKPLGLGIKFVAQGEESYWVKDKRFCVSNGKYLLVNETFPTVDIAIKKETTRAVCVDIDAALVNDLLLQTIYPNDLDNYNSTAQYLLTPELFVNEAVAEKPMQELLNFILFSSASQALDRPGIELIYELTSLVVKNNEETIKSYYNLEAAKLSTRQELFRRLLVGKEVLDDSLFSNLSIKQVAETCCLSEFRFYRLFKQCFGDSPYNYLYKKRIEKSVELKKDGLSWVEIATQLNFTDLAAFSKSFKKVKGVAPSKAFIH